MKLEPTPLAGAYVVELERISDERGWFARTYDPEPLQTAGIEPTNVQSSISFNALAGTLRGLHFQEEPHAEDKLVRCTRGAILDVIVDLRPQSPTYLSHVAVELSEENRRQLYVPEMFAHGYLSLTDGAEVAYQVGEFYTPGCERGIRYDDPALGIEWPIPIEVISDKDASWPPFEPVVSNAAVSNADRGRKPEPLHVHR